MENINKIAKVGDVFIRRDGKQCIYIASDGTGGLKYRFRLLKEHIRRIAECDYYNVSSNSELNIVLNNYLMRTSWSPWAKDREFIYPMGDWYTRFNGSASCCSKWKDDEDVIEKQKNMTKDEFCNLKLGDIVFDKQLGRAGVLSTLSIGDITVNYGEKLGVVEYDTNDNKNCYIDLVKVYDTQEEIHT